MQNIFIAILTYTRPLAEIDAVLDDHRKYLVGLFEAGKLLIAGRQNPRTGGIIIAQNISLTEFERILQDDPFSKVSQYRIIEFAPTFCNDRLKAILDAS